MFEKRLGEIAARRLEIRKALETDNAADVVALTKELKDLEAEKSNLEARAKAINELETGEPVAPVTPVVNPVIEGVRGGGAAADPEATYRTAWLKNLLHRSLTDVEKRAIASTDVSGAIPTQTSAEIVRKLKELVPMLNEITLLHVRGNVSIAVEGTKNAAAIHTESAAITPVTDTLVTVSLSGYEIVKIIRISATVQNMTINSFESWLIDMITESLAEQIEDYLINGTGSSQPKGIAKANTWVDDTNGIAWAGASLVAADISQAIALLGGGYATRAKFLMSHKTFWTSVMPIRDDSKAPIVSGNSASDYRIYGIPVIFSDKVAAGVIYLGDYKKVVANLAQDFTVTMSADSGFLYNAIDYRGACVFDSDIALGEAFIKIAAAL